MKELISTGISDFLPAFLPIHRMFIYTQEAKRILEAARREGTGWVKVDKELISKVDAALQQIDADLKKADRENSSLYFQARPPCTTTYSIDIEDFFNEQHSTICFWMSSCRCVGVC